MSTYDDTFTTLHITYNEEYKNYLIFNEFIYEGSLILVGDEQYLDEYLAEYSWDITDYYFVG